MKSKKLFIGFAVLLAAVFQSASVMAADKPLMLSLDEALTIALSESPSIIVADMEITKKDYSRKGAVGSLYPSVSASADYSRSLKIPVMYFDGFGGAGDGVKVGKDNSYTAAVSMSLPIVAPSLWKTIKLTESDIAISLEAARSSRITMINQVKRSYYAIMMAKDSYAVLKQSYENAKYNAQQYRNKYEQGVASEYDVLRAEVQVKTIEPGLLSAENAVGLSHLWLKVLLGIDESIDIQITKQLTDYELNMYSKRDAVDRSLENNSDLKQLDLQTDYLRETVKAQKAAFYPTLSAFANYNYSSMSDGGIFDQFRWIPSSTVGLSISVPILQGGNKFFNKKKAQLSVDQMKYNREDLIRNLTWKTSSSVDNIMASVKQIASSSEGVRQAEKAYSIMNKRFEVGNATFVELNDANDALTNSRLAYYQAIHDYLVGEANLEEILGSADISKYENKNK